MTIKEETVGVKNIVNGTNITIDDTDPKNPIVSVDSIDDTPIGATTPSTGDFTDLTATGAVDFSGASSVTFETGTPTLAVSDAASGGNNSGTAQTYASYQKVGNRITVDFSFQDIDTTGMTGGNTLYITGLPEVAKTITGLMRFVGIGQYASISFTGSLIPVVTDAGNTIRFINQGTGTFLTVSALTSGAADMWVQLTYETA